MEIPIFSDPKTLMKLMSVSRDFLLQRRENCDWIEGVHWFYLDPKQPKSGCRYVTALCLDWLANRDDPEAHKAVLERYLKREGLDRYASVTIDKTLPRLVATSPVPPTVA
ncbi:MAG: hypothetical protein F6K30_16255 [Cyanothece sp. SIO2G6]|nr:hypothetical protein [Cyanothece sp. SIO2G6]